MKKLLFGLIATVLLSNFSFGQSQNKKIYKSCVTVSCCGIGPFSIDVWSETTCLYISYKMASGNNLTDMIKLQETLSQNCGKLKHKITFNQKLIKSEEHV